jgi:gamma-glutamyltranspeptidase/glutathione hydrolase
VVDGYNSGIGGGCFILIRTADGKFHAIDGRETAPAAAHRNFYRDQEKQSGKVNSEASRLGPKAVAVPGALLAFEEAVDRFGKLSLSDLLLPAADIAEEGFAVSDVYFRRQTKVLDELRQYPESARVLLTADGQPLPPGHILKQPDLAETYRCIADCGTEWFYEGDFAESVSDWMADNGGQLTRADFANYRTVTRQPLRSTYRGHEVVGFPLPSSGGLHVAQILNMLESFPLGKIHRQDPNQATHVVAEAMKLAFADRAYWPGDPAFANVPRSLISREYAAMQTQKIDCDGCTEVASHGQPPNPDDVFVDRHTTHISTADAAGNWVAITSTINTTFGSKVIVPGTGVILNNEMDDFSIAPGVPNHFGLVGNENNGVEAGKRPLSSMSPTIVLRDGQPVLTVGAAGGPKIITQVLWALVNTIDFGMTPGEIMAQPRIHHQWSPDYLRVEETLPTATRNRLASYGHKLFIAGSHEVGVCQMITRDPITGVFTGAHDARVPGKAAGTNR